MLLPWQLTCCPVQVLVSLPHMMSLSHADTPETVILTDKEPSCLGTCDFSCTACVGYALHGVQHLVKEMPTEEVHVNKA